MRFLLLVLMAWVLTAALPDTSTGPYSVRWVTGDDDPDYAESDSSRWIMLMRDDQGHDFTDSQAIAWVRANGGVERNNLRTGRLETLRRFRVYTDQDFYFDDVVFSRTQFNDGDWGWIGKVSNENVVGERLGSGAHEFTLRKFGEAKSHLVVVKSWDALPIWNGYRGAFVFTTADGDEYNNDYLAVVDPLGVPYTAFIITEEVGTAGSLTWDEIRDMHDAGVEIAAHGRNDLWKVTDRRWGMVRLRPGAYSINEIDEDSSPSVAGSGVNVNDIGMHDGDNSREGEVNPGASVNLEDTYVLLNTPGVDDTLAYGPIDSVVVWCAWRLQSDNGIMPAGTRTVRFYKNSPSGAPWTAFVTSSVTLQNTTDYQMVRTKITGDGTTFTAPLYWTQVLQWAIGPQIVSSDSTIYYTQFFVDVHYGQIFAPQLDEWGLNLNPADHARADTLLYNELLDAPKLIEDQIKPYDIDYRCEGFQFSYNWVDAAALAAGAPFFKYMSAGYTSTTGNFVGLRDSDPTTPSWWDFRPYEITKATSPSNLFGSGASFSVAQVDSAVQAYLDLYADTASLSRNGGAYLRKNPLFITGAHNADEATAAQVEQMFKTIKADGRYWITTLREAVEYRNRAKVREEIGSD